MVKTYNIWLTLMMPSRQVLLTKITPATFDLPWWCQVAKFCSGLSSIGIGKQRQDNTCQGGIHVVKIITFDDTAALYISILAENTLISSVVQVIFIYLLFSIKAQIIFEIYWYLVQHFFFCVLFIFDPIYKFISSIYYFVSRNFNKQC